MTSNFDKHYPIVYFSITDLQDFLCKKLKIQKKELRWYHYKLFSQELDDLVVDSRETSQSSAKVFSGFVKRIDEFYFLFVNNSIKSDGRRHFTFCHEFYHYLYHFGKGLGTEFNDLISDNGYSEDIEPVELEADIGASLMMCSDEVLIAGLKNNWDWQKFCLELEMSQAALKIRITNYLQYNLQIPRDRAVTLSGAYTKGGTPERRNFLNVLITNWDFINSEFQKLPSLRFMSGYEYDQMYTKLNITRKPASHYHQAQNLFLDLYEVHLKCTQCKSNLYFGQNYCPVCRNSDPGENFGIRLIRESLSMKYSKIKTNENHTPLVCPRSEAEDLSDKFNYCPYCATFLHNSCLGPLNNRYNEPDEYNNIGEKPILEQVQNGCGGYLDGGFRFCPDCGSETSYFHQKLLKDWSKEKEELRDPFTGVKIPKDSVIE